MIVISLLFGVGNKDAPFLAIFAVGFRFMSLEPS